MNNDNLISIEEQPINLRKWISLFMRNWPLFLIGLFFALTISFLFVTFSVTQYQLSAHVLVRKDNNPLDKDQLFSAAFSNDPYQLENEKGILQSKSVTRNAIEKLDFNVSYYIRQKFQKAELYKSSPFLILIDTSHLQPLSIFFTIRFINDSLLYVSAEEKDVALYDYPSYSVRQVIPEFRFHDTVTFGQITGNSYCRFSILPNFEYIVGMNRNKDYYFQLHSLSELINSFRYFRIENDRGSTILTISLQSRNPKKAADFLNKLVQEYLNKGVERDNKIAKATIGFIDAQLVDIIDSLHISGQKLEDFKSTNKVLDLGIQAEKIYTKLENFESEKARLLVKKRYFNYLIGNLNTKSDVSDLIAPGTLEINDPLLEKLIIELAGMYTERAEISFNSIKDNPYLSSLEHKINDTRQKLSEAAKNILDATEIALEDLDNQIINAEQTLNKLPKDQQQLINIERRFKLNDELYTYLLTKRSDMEIFKASNIPANEILDNADTEDARIVSPNKKMSLMISIVLGFFLPGLFLYFRETINNKIRSREDIQKITQFPLVGQVVGTKNNVFPATLNQPNSVLTESYRTLRTNLQFIINESEPNIIMVTSAVQGEGKSFTALNLASVYSFYGKKTVLVDFDLRKSRTNQNLGIQVEKGLSNFLSKNATYDQIIYSGDILNFDLITAGPVPPNPSELASSTVLGNLFERLKQDYEMIIIDTPPVGIVSDALLIYHYADTCLLVARYNYTSIEVFESVMEDMKTRDLKKICIVLNDLVIHKTSYGYGYGYGYGYLSKEDNQNNPKDKNSL
jgi:tyrosine-protein kinase Etk/Wzc